MVAENQTAFLLLLCGKDVECVAYLLGERGARFFDWMLGNLT